MFFNFAVFHSVAIIGYMLNSLNLKHSAVFFYHCLCTSAVFIFVLKLCRILAYIIFNGIQPFHSFFHEFTLFLCGFLITCVKPLPN